MSSELYDQILPDNRTEVEAHCVRTLFERAKLGTMFAPLGTLFILWVVYDSVSLPLALGWVVVNSLPDAFTLALAMRLLKHPPAPEGIASAHRSQMLLRAVQGLCWGSATVLFHRTGGVTADDMIVLTALVSISSASVVNMAPSFRTLAVFSISLLAVPILYYFSLGDATHVQIAVGLSILLLIELQFGWDAYRQFACGVHQLVLNRHIQQELERRNEELGKLNQKLRVMAIHDQLTGLFNRHFMSDLMVRQREGFVRHGHPCSLVLFDLDHFKQINDRYGHAVGDEVLVAFSRLIEGLLRQGDLLGRYGGEEFVIVLPMTERDAALQLAERLRDALAAKPLLERPEPLTVTASFGVAQLSPGEDVDAWLVRADQALYRAKQHGRNCAMA